MKQLNEYIPPTAKYDVIIENKNVALIALKLPRPPPCSFYFYCQLKKIPTNYY